MADAAPEDFEALSTADITAAAPEETDVDEPPRPRRHRSTFTTERKRPASRTTPLPPLVPVDPVVADIDLTDPAPRLRRSAAAPPRVRTAVAPPRDSADTPAPTESAPVQTAPTGPVEPIEPVLGATVAVVAMPQSPWAPPSAPVEVIVPPRPPLPEAAAEEAPARALAAPGSRRARRLVTDGAPSASPQSAGLDEVAAEPAPIVDVVSAPGPVAELDPLVERDPVAEPDPVADSLPEPHPFTASTAGSALEPDLAEASAPHPEGGPHVEHDSPLFAAMTAPTTREEDAQEPVDAHGEESSAAHPTAGVGGRQEVTPASRASRRAGRVVTPIAADEPVAAEESTADPAAGEIPTAADHSAAAESELPSASEPPVDPARTRRAGRLRASAGLALTAVLVLAGATVVTSAFAVTLGGDPAPVESVADVHDPADVRASLVAPKPADPAPALEAPAPQVTNAAVSVDLCADPAFTGALAAADDAQAIALAGGAAAFRSAVAAGTAACVPLGDPAHVWVVVNKVRPYSPADFAPLGLAQPPGVRNLIGGSLTPAAGQALGEMVAGAAAAGAGELALASAYRSFSAQERVYGAQVGALGTAGADLVSARPGFSEHQSGLAADVVACAGDGCGGLDTFAGTTQSAWVAEHSWEFGWIVRYEDGATGVSGYSPEPWHLRYVGRELAAVYHAGGFRTLEEFFGLPAAPHYD